VSVFTHLVKPSDGDFDPISTLSIDMQLTLVVAMYVTRSGYVL